MNLKLPLVAQNFDQIKYFLIEKTATEKSQNYLSELSNKLVNSISQTKNKAVEVISQTAENTKNQLSQTTNNAIESLSEKTSQAVDSISKITTQTKDAIAETTHNLTDTATTATNQAIERFTGVTESAIKIGGNWSDRITQTVQNAISPRIAEWINSHPALVWLLNHPLISFGISLLAIFIIWGFLQIVSDLAKTICLFILRSPFKIVKSIWSFGRKSAFVKEELTVNQTSPSNYYLRNNLTFTKHLNHQMNDQDRLTHIWNRLEEIKQEQSQLLQVAAEIIQKQSKV